MIDNNDNQLIDQYLSGDETSLNLLVGKYFRRVFSFIYLLVHDKKEAEDLAQETFVKTWKGLKRFDQTKNFRSWLLTIAKNRAIDYLRQKKSLPFSSLSQEKITALESLTDASPLPSEEMEKIIAGSRLNQSLADLPARQRAIISLYYEDGLNFREIAEIMTESVNTVKSRHRRAIFSLRRSMDKSDI